MNAIVGMELVELEPAVKPEPAYRARQIFDYVYARRILDFDKMTSLPAALRKRLASELPVGMPTVNHRYDSSDGTRRYLLDLADGRTVETVLMPQDDRDTICISSQVGCAVDCKFCLTAKMGLERNLTAGEIVAQVLLVMEHNQLSPTDRRLNLVMMGMGEPLLNLPNVLKATRLLTGAIGIAPKRITLSTSGIIPKMEELGLADVRPRLAISLNASYEAQRREIMPITKKYHLADLMEACRRYPLRKDERLTFEYVLLKDVNDSDEDARRVVQLIGKLNCKVNLIALNPGPGIAYGTPSAERVASFQRIIREHVSCYVRKPRGLDIYAACGQLKRMSSEALVTVG